MFGDTHDINLFASEVRDDLSDNFLVVLANNDGVKSRPGPTLSAQTVSGESPHSTQQRATFALRR